MHKFIEQLQKAFKLSEAALNRLLKTQGDANELETVHEVVSNQIETEFEHSSSIRPE